LSDGPNNADMQRAKEQAQTRKALQALGDKVQRLRLLKSWSRTTLARKAGVTVATVRGCEEGTKVTQADKLKNIARALGVSRERLETDEKDPRVKNWGDEDYEIGNWYHHAPRQLKNRVWALQEITEAGAALTDPQFATLLEGWSRLTQLQKTFILNSFNYIQKNPDAGGADVIASADQKTRGPQR